MKPRLIAYYLPQFHPIKENNEWWGVGFTEWTNTAKAKSHFPGHYQPHVPADLGFYDLRLAETRYAQAEMAKAYGIEGFCYYHYWFGNGRRLLERPFNEVLATGEPDYPFCLCWANETWTGIWHGAENRLLIEQKYPGEEDDRAHFNTLLPAFRDKRYMTVDGKPIFVLYKPHKWPDTTAKIKLWQSMALEAGLPGLHLVGVTNSSHRPPELDGFDASIYTHTPMTRSWGSWSKPHKLFYNKFMRWLGRPNIHEYKNVIDDYVPDFFPPTQYPSVVHAWDNTPRSGSRGLVLTGSTPKLFSLALRKAFRATRDTARSSNNRLIFLKSWNEWAEGNHLEPDIRDGHGYLEVIRDELERELDN